MIGKLGKNMPINSIRRWTFIFIAIIVVIVGGYHSILQSDVFLLEKIVVKGNNQIPTEKIISASGIKIGADKVSSLSDEEIEKKLLNKITYIKHADVKTEAPGTLIIEIVEREPVAIIPFHTANGKLYGLIDIEGSIVEIVDQSDIYTDMIILTGVIKEGEEGTISINDESIPLFLDDSLSSYFSQKLSKKAIQIALNILRRILENRNPVNYFGEAQTKPPNKMKISRVTKQRNLVNSEGQLFLTDFLSSEILSINTKDANKITLKLKNNSVVWLSSDYLADGLHNFKTVFLYHKNYDYFDARFEGTVYCGRESR